MKPAVFQVDQPDGFVRLICIYVPTLRRAVEIERAIRDKLPGGWYVSLLGRFDRIEVANTAEEFLDTVLEPEFCLVNRRTSTANRRERKTLASTTASFRARAYLMLKTASLVPTLFGGLPQ